MARAMPAMVHIGDRRIDRCSIAPDGRSITCYLDEMPEEGARITVSYGRGKTGEMPEPFSRARMPGDEPPSNEPE
jgi:hypothetical protein